MSIPLEGQLALEQAYEQGFDEGRKSKHFGILMIITIILWVVTIGTCFAEEIPFTDKNCIRAAIGEAANQGYHGLLAVCVGIRNRGSLRGVYGVNNPIVDKQPRYIWQMAERAWTESQWNILHTGTHWESTDFPTPPWAPSMKIVYRHKKHIFYRRLSNVD